MIPLTLPCAAEGDLPYVTRLRTGRGGADPSDTLLFEEDDEGSCWAGSNGLVVVDGLSARELDGDVVAIFPASNRLERLLRAGSLHNTLLATERCDQLCVMCSQPPKKTHDDRFHLFEEACYLAEPGIVIGVSGGEPTLYKEQLLGMIERVLTKRPDLSFHILTNAQHFESSDIERLRAPLYRSVVWGIPLYAAVPDVHDDIVGKQGAFVRLEQSLAALIYAGARIELRTVVLTTNVSQLPALARRIAGRLRFIESWSIMQLENIGFARNRWTTLYFDHGASFDAIAAALDTAQLHGIPARLFNFPRCTVPAHYRHLAPASISDWKRKYAPACEGCSEQSLCSGFFEWHPQDALREVQPL